MTQIINLIDKDVDGCGTNIETLFVIEGKQKLTTEIIQKVNTVIEKYKKENEGEWETDSILDVVCEYLENKGYMCDYIRPDVIIEF